MQQQCHNQETSQMTVQNHHLTPRHPNSQHSPPSELGNHHSNVNSQTVQLSLTPYSGGGAGTTPNHNPSCPTSPTFPSGGNAATGGMIPHQAGNGGWMHMGSPTASHSHHNTQQRQPIDRQKLKTKLCRNFAMGIDCPYKEKCAFAHGGEHIQSMSPAPSPAGSPTQNNTNSSKNSNNQHHNNSEGGVIITIHGLRNIPEHMAALMNIDHNVPSTALRSRFCQRLPSLNDLAGLASSTRFRYEPYSPLGIVLSNCGTPKAGRLQQQQQKQAADPATATDGRSSLTHQHHDAGEQHTKMTPVGTFMPAVSSIDTFEMYHQSVDDENYVMAATDWSRGEMQTAQMLPSDGNWHCM